MAYSLTYSYDSTSQSYSVTGYSNITTSDKVVIPDKYDDGTHGEHPVTSIGSSVFRDCNGLTNVTIPDSVTSIGDRAFRDCHNLMNVSIGNSVTSIGYSAFEYCPKLKQIVLFPPQPPTLGSNAIPSNVQSIYVQQSSKKDYQAATNWTTFASKIVSDNVYLSFVRFNQKNKEYIGEKINEAWDDFNDDLERAVYPIIVRTYSDTLLKASNVGNYYYFTDASVITNSDKWIEPNGIHAENKVVTILEITDSHTGNPAYFFKIVKLDERELYLTNGQGKCSIVKKAYGTDTTPKAIGYYSNVFSVNTDSVFGGQAASKYTTLFGVNVKANYNAEGSIVGGRYCIIDSPYTFAYGRGITTQANNETNAKVVLGYNNKFNPKAILEVGNGINDNKSNAFEVLKDGRAKVQSAPTERDDVVRKLELDKKLSKPTTPTAESAVILGTDGTASTKPLSELGGKLYRHELHCNITGISGIGDIYIYVINTSQDAITNITSLPLGYYTTYFYQYQKYGFGYIYIRVNNFITMSYVAINDENNSAIFGAEKTITFSSISDKRIEL